jgi:hypothetical protein
MDIVMMRITIAGVIGIMVIAVETTATLIKKHTAKYANALTPILLNPVHAVNKKEIILTTWVMAGVMLKIIMLVVSMMVVIAAPTVKLKNQIGINSVEMIVHAKIQRKLHAKVSPHAVVLNFLATVHVMMLITTVVANGMEVIVVDHLWLKRTVQYANAKIQR